MACGAGLIARGREIDSSAMLDVAFRAIERAGLFRVMNRPVVAGEAGGAFSLGAEVAGLLNVASGALRFENGVGFAETAARVDARIVSCEVVRDPDEGNERE